MNAVERASAAGLLVTYQGDTYPAEPVAGGAAFELLADRPLPGFLPNPDHTGPPYRRFVHVSDVTAVAAAPAGGATSAPAVPAYGEMPGGESPLCAPLSRSLGWPELHRISQTPLATHNTPWGTDLITSVRTSATLRRGTRMLKALSAAQLAGYLRGALPTGFCYREYDVAHLRTAEELRVLRTDAISPNEDGEVGYALRWRAVDPADYEIPFTGTYGGLVGMPPHDRLGPPVLGTGFTPSDQHLIPEFVTTDFADVPLTAGSALLAFLADGTEVPLYSYRPEQRGWLRMAGPRWRHLLAGIEGVAPDQEYVPRPAQAGQGTSWLLGLFQGELHETIADPPEEFRVLAPNRAARYPVGSLLRRTRYASWRGVTTTVVRADDRWARLRLRRPDPETAARLGAQCLERGLYEAWAPVLEVTDYAEADLPYVL